MNINKFGCSYNIVRLEILKRTRKHIRDVIPYTNRADLIPVNAEAICLEVKKPKAKPVLISTWYRPPGSNMEFFNDFENFIKVIDNENKEIIITGDFNCDMLDSNYRNNNSKRLDDLLDIYQLQQHIDKPTRTTDSTKTLIDIIITKSDDTKTSDSGVIALGNK